MAALVATLVTCLFTTAAMAQQQNFQQQAQQIDPQQAQQRLQQFNNQGMQDIRDQLGVTDEEWAVIQPRIQKVRDAEQAAGVGQLNQLGRLARGRPGQAGININALLGIKDSTVQQRQAELQKAIDEQRAMMRETERSLAQMRIALTSLLAQQEQLKARLSSNAAAAQQTDQQRLVEEYRRVQEQARASELQALKAEQDSLRAAMQRLTEQLEQVRRQFEAASTVRPR